MIVLVVGARPNFVKMSPLVAEMKKRNQEFVLVHTGQHYDFQMSQIFFDELEMPAPDIYLGAGSGSHAAQTASILVPFEESCLKLKPRLVIVAGDVNSTLACALVAAKLNISIAHVEAGLRSFDRTMPEEINRQLTDHLAELLFVTEPSGEANLLREGVEPGRIFFVGNTMIDSLRRYLPKALDRQPWRRYAWEEKQYGVVTLHRPSNVDSLVSARELIGALSEIGKKVPLLFPMHPRTAINMKIPLSSLKGVHIVEPLGYLDFLGLVAKAKFVITDSGGIQEETTVLGVPCITVRGSTERPITLTEGTNRLVSQKASEIVLASGIQTNYEPRIPKFWDGNASSRVVDVIQKWLIERRFRDGIHG